MVTKARQLAEFIANADVDSDEIATGAVSASKLADTLDLSSKTIVMPDVAAFNITSGDRVGIKNSGTDISGTSLDDLVVGAGTTLAGMVLDGGASNDTAYGFANAGTKVGRIQYINSSNNMVFQTNNANRMVIDGSGNVGIGTTSPVTKVQIGDGIAASNRLRFFVPNAVSLGGGIQFYVASTEYFNIDYNSDTNKLVFNTDTTFNSNTYMMTMDRQNFRVGIGTDSPIDLLTATGTTDPRIAVRMLSGGSDNPARMIIQTNSTKTTNADAFITFDNNQTSDVGTAWMVGTDASAASFKIAAADLGYFNGTNEYLTINSSGDVGIGRIPAEWNTSSGYRHINLGNSAWLRADTDTSNNFLQTGVNAVRDATGWKFEESGYATNHFQGTTLGHTFSTSSVSGTAGGTISWVDHLVINTDGNVGIGTNNPTHTLQVDSTSAVPLKIKSTSTSGTGLYLDNDRSGSKTFGILSGNVAAGYFNIKDEDAGVNRFVISDTGNIGIGQTAPAVKLHIGNGTGTSPHMFLDGIFGSTAKADHSRIYFGDYNFGIGAGNWSGSNNDDLYIWAYGGTGRDIRFATTTNGNTDVTDAAWSTNMVIQANGDVRFGIGNSHTPLIQGVTNNGRIASSPGYSFNGDLNTGMFQPATFDTIAFATAGAERMRIDASGRVGIGTTAPAAATQLDVDQTIRVGNMHGSDYDGSAGVMLSHSKSLSANTQTNVLRLGNREGCFILTVYIGWSDSGAAAVAQYDVHTFYAANTVTQVKSVGRAGGNSVSLALSSSGDYHTFQVTTSQAALVTVTIVGTSAGRTGVANHFTVDYY